MVEVSMNTIRMNTCAKPVSFNRLVLALCGP
jgi:hypothetical protein